MPIGKLLPSITLTMVRRLAGHLATGPRGLLAQSIVRSSAPISPPPARQWSKLQDEGFWEGSIRLLMFWKWSLLCSCQLTRPNERRP
jgi:hypothetical protein